MTPRESASVWRRTHPGAPHPPKPRRAGGAHDPDRAADRAPCGRRLPRRRQHRRPGARPVCHGPDAMTRAEAIERTLTALNSEDWPHAKGVVDVLGALGVIRAPNGKSHFVPACVTLVDADVSLYFFRRRVGSCNVHFAPAPTIGQLIIIRH